MKIIIVFIITLIIGMSCRQNSKQNYDLGVEHAEILPILDTFQFQETEEYYNSANIILKSGNYKESIPLYDKALKLEPKNTAILNHKALAVAEIDPLSGIQIINKAIEIRPNYAMLYNNRGLMYYKLKKNETAILDFKKSLQLDPKTYSTYVNLGLANYFLGNIKEFCTYVNEGIDKGYDLKADEFTNGIFNVNCNGN